MELNKVYKGDCLELMKNIPDESIDMILVDPPYERTHNKWDSIIPLNMMWEQYLRIIKPMRVHEEVCIFYKKPPVYNPQKVLGAMNHSKGKKKACDNNNYGKYEFVDNREELGEWKHPTSILRFQKPHPSVVTHPTEKPVELCEWLIKSYTNKGDTVLDSCAGSGTTCIAAINTSRNYIAMESEEKYCRAMEKRISEHRQSIEKLV